jgi:hypothetical protein
MRATMTTRQRELLASTLKPNCTRLFIRSWNVKKGLTTQTFQSFGKPFFKSGLNVNVRESWQKHKALRVARHGTAHKLKLDESAENSQRVSGTACMARNVINDTANLKLVWNEQLGLHPPCTTHPLLHANESRLSANCSASVVISNFDREF